MLSLIVAVAFAGFLAGCNDAGPQKLDENYLKNAEEVGKHRRELFVKSNGNMDALSAEDRAAYVKEFKSEDDAKKFWDLMKNPPTSSRPSGMPGGN